MVTGVYGSLGENAPPPVEVARGHVSDSVTVHLPVTAAGHVRETPPSCPGVTLRPVQVRRGLKRAACVILNTLEAFITLCSSGGPQRARGSIIGNINDIEFGIAILNATITDGRSGGKIIKATISNVPRALGEFPTISYLYVVQVLPTLN